MDAKLKALADGTRRRILGLVWRQERSACTIAAEFPVSRPAISQHLGILLASDLIIVRRAGTRRLYRANRRAITQLRADLGVFWDKSLKQLKIAAEAAERKKRQR
jgi:DNA-binding transcriptional ArsR family regulator